MNIIDKVLQEASTLGIVVDHGTSNRAWVKAACLFIEHYVLSTVSTCTVQDSDLLKEVLSVFLKNARFCRTHEQESNGNKVGCSFMQYDLPTRKPFMTITRLINKYSEAPRHSHFNMLSDGKTCSSCDCNHDNWKCIPGIVVGIIKLDETKKEMVLSDKSGCIPVHVINMKYDFLYTVCLLMTWNYVPDVNKKAGYIEILDDPVVLKHLKSDNCPGQIIFMPSLGFDCGETASSITNVEKQFAISGYVSSMTSKNSTCASVCLESQPYWKKSVIMYNDSCVDNFDVIGNVELSISFLPLLSFGCMIEVTHLQKTECLSSTATFTATASTHIMISHQSEKLSSLFKQKDECLIAINDASKTSNGILSFYAGKVSKILSKNLGIILLEDGELIVFLMDYRGSYCGLREGAIIALKNFHLCVVDQRPAAVCCAKLSSIEVLKHSNLPTHSFVIKHDEFSEILRSFHPSTLFSVLSACDYIFPHVPATTKEDVLKEDWFENLFLHEQSDKSSVKDRCNDCSGKQVLFKIPQSFKCVSLKMLRDVVFGEAQKTFGGNATSWKSSIFHCKDIFEKCSHYVGTNTLVCIGAILSSAGCGLKLFDGRNSLKCLTLPSNCSLKGTLYEKSEDHWRNFSSFDIDCSGSLVKINDFWLVVETKAESSDVNTTNSSLHQRVYLVASISSIVFLTSNTIHPRLTRCNDFYEDDCIFCIGKRRGFSITTLKYSISQPPVEYHVEFSGKAAKFYSLLHPTMLIEINFDAEDETAFDKCVYYNNNCSLRHISNFKDSHNFVSSETEDFYNCAYQEWKKNHFSQGILSVYKAHELYMSPPTKLPQLVAVCGTIIQRIECKSDTSPALDQQSFVVSFSTSNNWLILSHAHDCKRCGPQFQGGNTCVTFDAQSSRFPLQAILCLPGKLLNAMHIDLNSLLQDDTRGRVGRPNIYGSSDCAFNCIVYVKVRLRENHQQCLLGLVPGAFVTFYRVKCLLSLQGDVYCLCTPTSFHVIHRIDMTLHASLSVSLLNKSANNLTNLSASRCFLYHIYEKEWIEDKFKAIQVKAHIVRLLNVRLEAVNGSVKADHDVSSRRTFYENFVTKDLEHELRKSTSVFVKKAIQNLKCYVSRAKKSGSNARNGLCEGERLNDKFIFQAKCVVSDSSAKIILYINNQHHFCHMTGIEPEGWNDVIALLKQSSTKSFYYDCNLHDGKEVFHTETDEAGLLAIALFNDINTTILPSRDILIRHRPLCKKRSWNSAFAVDGLFVDRVNEESLFRIGTVALEGQGSTSIRSISRRLLQFSCLAVK